MEKSIRERISRAAVTAILGPMTLKKVRSPERARKPMALADKPIRRKSRDPCSVARSSMPRAGTVGESSPGAAVGRRRHLPLHAAHLVRTRRITRKAQGPFLAVLSCDLLYGLKGLFDNLKACFVALDQGPELLHAFTYPVAYKPRL